jgi:WD40 repeat protein
LPRQQGSRTKCIHVSADGGSAVTLLFDSSMAVYDLLSSSLRCQLMQRGERDAQRVHSAGVNAVYLNADGSCAISVSKDCTARIWDASTGGCLMVLQVGREDEQQAAVGRFAGRPGLSIGLTVWC